jgi:hypothetical protein
MSTPFADFANLKVRVPLKTFKEDPNGFITRDMTSEDYVDLTMFFEKSTSRNPTIPSDLDSFNQIKLGISVFPMYGYFVEPERRPEYVQLNKNYYSIYKPEFFNPDSTIQYCQIRFILTPLDPVDAGFYTGDFSECILILQNNKIEDEDLYPTWEM